MFRRLLFLFAAALFSLTLAPGAAEASRASDYRDAMTPFLPIIEDWADESRAAALASVTRPSSLPDPQVAELVERGRSIEADLIGTSATAPVSLKGRHLALARHVRHMTDALTRLDEGPAAAASSLTLAHDALQNTLQGARSILRRGR